MALYLFKGKRFFARNKAEILRKAGLKVNDRNNALIVKVKRMEG